jgi:hypothetical protein
LYGLDPGRTSQKVAELIGLSCSNVKTLEHELHLTDEDPIFAVRLNTQWIAVHGQAAADAFLDGIATFQMQAPQRRDSGVGHRWLLHFDDSSVISECRAFILQNFPVAFALGPASPQFRWRFAPSSTSSPFIKMTFKNSRFFTSTNLNFF